MIRKTNYILALLLVIGIADLSAQNSQVLHYMNLPQNHLINPALRQSNSFFIGLPLISGINLKVSNNFVNFSDVFMKGETGDSVSSIFHRGYNIDKFLAKIKDKNSMETQALVQLFGLGFSLGKNSYVFIDVNERMEGKVVIPRDLFALILKGNDQFVGSKIDFSSFRGDVKYYREVGLGFSTNITSKLRVGVKGKLLFGIAALSINNRSFGVSIDTSFLHTIDADISVNISAPVKININPDHSIESIGLDDSRFKTSRGISGFLSGRSNIGLGLDFGATYDISDKFMISASVTDIGFIWWKKDVTNLLVKSRYKFGGLNIVDAINGTKTFDELGSELVDSLNKAFSFTGSNVHFKENLQYGLTLGGSYNLTKSISLGLLAYRRIMNYQVNESLTFSANVNLTNTFSSSLSYTIANHNSDNLGAGLAFRKGIFQLYILSDRIPLNWNKIKFDKNKAITIPSDWNTLNLRLGVNLVFGNNKKKGDKPMIIVE